MKNLHYTYTSWDREMATRNPDYKDLYTQMIKVSKNESFEKYTSFWWRLSAVTFGLATASNLDPMTQMAEIQSKMREARQYAVEKAVKLSPNHFEANLWAAKIIWQSAIYEGNHQSVLNVFLEHLKQCIATKPNHWQVLWLEAQVRNRSSSDSKYNSICCHLVILQLNTVTT